MTTAGSCATPAAESAPPTTASPVTGDDCPDEECGGTVHVWTGEPNIVATELQPGDNGWEPFKHDAVAAYGYQRTDIGIRCTSCDATFPAADGSVMRGHAKRCPVNPRTYRVPGVCQS